MRRDELQAGPVAEEMIHRGEYAVPRLLGEPELSQPPMRAWLTVLVSAGRPRASAR